MKKASKEDLLQAIESVIRMDKGMVKRLEWDEFKTTVKMFNTWGTCFESCYIGTSSPIDIMLIVAAKASSLKKGGR